jgi:hypothetical protein
MVDVSFKPFAEKFFGNNSCEQSIGDDRRDVMRMPSFVVSSLLDTALGLFDR